MTNFIEPNISLKSKIQNFKDEFIFNNEVIHGGSRLENYDIPTWLVSIENVKMEKTCPEGMVTAHTFLIVNEEKIVGIINARHKLNDYLLKHGGHIGYSIRKSERNKGYAKKGLNFACQFLFNNFHLDKVLVTCDIENHASKSVIEACGGIFENEFSEENRTSLRYWIYKN
ncbi:GNAT family N-acetyltransferase [Gemella cuniculi]|uniref:GNAT family N-acetyltransferase n=1 Tax=Gemella cuniculi TaxID=150240 RepID=UPI00040E2DB7|nr:GNAT family N-acetyltransferase [Gemella cuniculi]